jgi:ATP-dependent exoDNAse (exonuclease V) alpha subunit
VALVQHHHWRLACVGDPYQLPAVGRGGIFAHWCDTLPAARLEEVRRFAQAWEAQASLLLRAGDPRAVEAYAARRRLKTTHPALVAERVAREHKALVAKGAAVAITTSSAARAREINEAIQHHQRSRRRGNSARLRDGTQVWAGDRIATRRNDRALLATDGSSVRNRQTWTVTAVGADGSLTVSGPERGDAVLPADYVARHVELGWAVTGYGNQGVTVDVGICVVEPSTSRAGLYVGMTRGRQHNAAWVIDATGNEDPAETLSSIIQRPATGETAHAVRDQLHGYEVLDVPPKVRQARERLEEFERRAAQRRSSPPREPSLG